MPAPTVRLLLARRELSLRLLTSPDALPDGALDAAVSWVHSSDLDDPTPFLTPGQVLLTTGTQFESADSDYDGYVARLVVSGVVALGFGTEVIRDTPPGLIEACLRGGMPLLDVPYRTPFIAVARYAADLVAEQAYARNTWALAAQHAVSLAALRPDGLDATLAELARQLGRWVALVDAAGTIDRVFPDRAMPAPAREIVTAEAGRMLRARRRSGATVSEAGTVIALQTIGAGDRLLGVLAHGGPDEPDQAAQQVVTSVVALAGLALEQGQALESARTALRRALLSGIEQSRRLADELGRASGLSVASLDVLDRAGAQVNDVLGAEPPMTSAEPGAGRDRAGGGPSPLPPEDEDAPVRATALLEPLTATDRDGTLAVSLLTWLEHNGVYDAAARELGVHRHTLHARIRTAERLLDRDFTAFADRAEVWTALRLG
ncbi:hypothetical protein GCM10027568_30480 [Humibacter soli]